LSLKYKNHSRTPNILTFSGCILGFIPTKHKTIPIHTKKQALSLLGYVWGVALSIVFFAAFLHAYFGNNYRFFIDINGLGEAHIELVAFAIVIPLMCYGLYLQCKELKKNAPAKT